MIKLERTNKFYEEIKTMGFFKRLFSWGRIIPLLVESSREIEDIKKVVDENNDLSSKIKVKNQEIKSLNKEIAKSENKNNELGADVKRLNQETKESAKKIAEFEKVKEEQQEEYDARISRLDKREVTVEERRQEIEDERVEEQQKKFDDMKNMWKTHEARVNQSIKQICRKYAIDYIDKEKAPFKGKPDNTIRIANEFIIFDAKSPGSDDLKNFPAYIKKQAEAVKKYVKEPEVKKDVFLVVPTNTIDKLEATFYDMSDHRAYIVAEDSLEPIILSFKKIGEYELVKELSPEDREDICRVIGHFAHHTKRRLQIDSFLEEKSLELLRSCEDLPEDVFEKVKDHEGKTKLNVPMEKISKKTDVKKLADKRKSINKELEIQNVNTEVDLKKIDDIPLYKKDK